MGRQALRTTAEVGGTHGGGGDGGQVHQSGGKCSEAAAQVLVSMKTRESEDTAEGELAGPGVAVHEGSLRSRATDEKDSFKEQTEITLAIREQM